MSKHTWQLHSREGALTFVPLSLKPSCAVKAEPLAKPSCATGSFSPELSPQTPSTSHLQGILTSRPRMALPVLGCCFSTPNRLIFSTPPSLPVLLWLPQSSCPSTSQTKSCLKILLLGAALAAVGPHSHSVQLLTHHLIVASSLNPALQQ